MCLSGIFLVNRQRFFDGMNIGVIRFGDKGSDDSGEHTSAAGDHGKQGTASVQFEEFRPVRKDVGGAGSDDDTAGLSGKTFDGL